MNIHRLFNGSVMLFENNLKVVHFCENRSREQTNLFLHGHGVSEVNGQLTNVDKGVLIGDLRVQRVHFCQSSLHEVDHGEYIGRSELAVLHIGNVHLLQKEKKYIN